MKPESTKPHIAENAWLVPLLTALVVHGVLQDRAWLSGVAGVLVVVAAALPALVVRNNLLAWILAGVGVAAEFAASWSSPLPTASLPAPVMAVACGAALGLMVFGTWTGVAIQARVAAWTLVMFSANAESTLNAVVLCICMCGAELLAVFVDTRMHRQGLAAFAWLLALMVALVPVTWGVVGTVRASEGYIAAAAYGLLRDVGLTRGLGLDDTIRLGTSSSASASEDVFFELQGTMPERLRTVVLEDFDGATWRATRNSRRSRPAWHQSPQPALLTLLMVQEIGVDVVPAPAGMVRVGGMEASLTRSDVVRGTAVVGRPVTLEFIPGQDAALGGAPSPEMLHLPPILATYMTQKGHALTDALATPLEKAHAVEAFFREGFEYSLEVDLDGSAHPLVALIEGRRAAYCSYFAAATALLLRGVGIPTRLVGGFLLETPNALTGRLDVMGRDAHAWVEMWDAGSNRFVMLDPTPWRAREKALGLDAHRLPFLGDAFAAARALLGRVWSRLRHDPAGTLLDFLLSPAGVALLGVGVWILWRNRAKPRVFTPPRGAMHTQDPQLQEVRARFNQVLQGVGLTVSQDALTDAEVLSLLTSRASPVVEDAQAFVTLWQQVRFGGAAARQELLEVLQRLEAHAAVLAQKSAPSRAP